jgi:hypothetical protein
MDQTIIDFPFLVSCPFQQSHATNAEEGVTLFSCNKECKYRLTKLISILQSHSNWSTNWSHTNFKASNLPFVAAKIRVFLAVVLAKMLALFSNKDFTYFIEPIGTAMCKGVILNILKVALMSNPCSTTGFSTRLAQLRKLALCNSVVPFSSPRPASQSK